MKEHNYYLIHNINHYSWQLIKHEISLKNYIKFCFNIIKVYLFELWYEYIVFRSNTAPIIELNDLSINSQNLNEGVHYRPSHYYIIFKAFNNLSKIVNLKESGIVDYGSGMGRVIRCAIRKGFKIAVGIEFSDYLCNQSKNYLQNCDSKKYKIINVDAVDYKLEENINIVFLFQPFSESLFRKVLININNSQNDIYLISIFDRYTEILIRNGFRRINDFTMNTRVEYVLWAQKN